MDFWTRLLGSAIAPSKPPRPPANDATNRLARFKRVYYTLIELCNRPRNPDAEGPLLDQLHAHLERLSVLLREETRAPVPHVCFQFAASHQIYAAAARAATVSRYEPIIRSGVAVFAALVDSEEEDFLSNEHFAKSLMRLVRKVVDSGDFLIGSETETAILELLFTIAAKIRLQPEILPVWFQSTAKPELEDVFAREKKSFVGITQKDDFPLCYLLIDRVHHEGRIGDFARTGLLYVFEATGRSTDLEEWVVSSDLPTLMASGLGALYSQLSRELSILHADAELPAVLAMSDYSTTHPRATAESAFSERHRSHMTTFLSYLAFWQDVLDHCRSPDVKQTLLDHFQILFLQQLLYPSLLQSSDTDAGSSVAVLTYMTAILDALEYPELLHIILTYLLAIQDQPAGVDSVPPTPSKSDVAPRSPTTVKRRQSLMLLSAPKDPKDAVEPVLFNLIDLITNNVGSRNSQSVFAALKLASTLLVRQKQYAFGNLVKTHTSKASTTHRTVGALERELHEYAELATSLHPQYGLDLAYSSLCEDARFVIEAQLPATQQNTTTDQVEDTIGSHDLSDKDPFMRSIGELLRTFWTNSIDVNLALTQAIISIAQCVEIRPESWITLGPSSYKFAVDTFAPLRAWQSCLDSEEASAWTAVSNALRWPEWPTDGELPLLYRQLRDLAVELEVVRSTVSNFDQLVADRKAMLQANHSDAMALPSFLNFPIQRRAMLEVPKVLQSHSRSSSRSSVPRGRMGETNLKATNIIPTPHSGAPSSAASRPTSRARNHAASTSPGPASIFQPPPPETPSTTDVLMQIISFPDTAKTDPGDDYVGAEAESDPPPHQDQKEPEPEPEPKRTASLNHILTNVVILQEFILELVAVLQVRAAVLGEREVRYA